MSKPFLMLEPIQFVTNHFLLRRVNLATPFLQDAKRYKDLTRVSPLSNTYSVRNWTGWSRTICDSGMSVVIKHYVVRQLKVNSLVWFVDENVKCYDYKKTRGSRRKRCQG